MDTPSQPPDSPGTPPPSSPVPYSSGSVPPPLPPPMPPPTPLPPHMLAATPYRPDPMEPRPSVGSVIAGLFLAAGIWSIIASLLVASLSACCWITWALQLALAIVCIIHGARMLGDETVPPSKLAAWGLVAMLVNCDVVSFVLGIIVLTQMADHRLRAWYEARGIRA